MRIISQFGCVDLPYEQTIVFMEGGKIYAKSQDKNFLMGKYQNTAQAEKVMDMLHEEYENFLYSRGGIVATADFYVQLFGFVPPRAFLFSKEEDVE